MPTQPASSPVIRYWIVYGDENEVVDGPYQDQASADFNRQILSEKWKSYYGNSLRVVKSSELEEGSRF